MLKVLANLPGTETVSPGPGDSRSKADYLTQVLPASIRDQIELVIVEDDDEARGEIGEAEVYFGSLTPELLQQARKLRWVQSTAASQERHLFAEFCPGSDDAEIAKSGRTIFGLGDLWPH